MEAVTKEKIARALFNPKLLELYSSMRWENLPDDIRESYLERAERLHNCFVELGYRKLPEGKPPLLGDEELIELGYGMTEILSEPPERCVGYLREIAQAQWNKCMGVNDG